MTELALLQAGESDSELRSRPGVVGAAQMHGMQQSPQAAGSLALAGASSTRHDLRDGCVARPQRASRRGLIMQLAAPGSRDGVLTPDRADVGFSSRLDDEEPLQGAYGR
jgi:hypothetical protein